MEDISVTSRERVMYGVLVIRDDTDVDDTGKTTESPTTEACKAIAEVCPAEAKQFASGTQVKNSRVKGASIEHNDSRVKEGKIDVGAILANVFLGVVGAGFAVLQGRFFREKDDSSCGTSTGGIPATSADDNDQRAVDDTVWRNDIHIVETIAGGFPDNNDISSTLGTADEECETSDSEGSYFTNEVTSPSEKLIDNILAAGEEDHETSFDFEKKDTNNTEHTERETHDIQLELKKFAISIAESRTLASIALDECNRIRDEKKRIESEKQEAIVELSDAYRLIEQLHSDNAAMLEASRRQRAEWTELCGELRIALSEKEHDCEMALERLHHSNIRNEELNSMLARKERECSLAHEKVKSVENKLQVQHVDALERDKELLGQLLVSRDTEICSLCGEIRELAQQICELQDQVQAAEDALDRQIVRHDEEEQKRATQLTPQKQSSKDFDIDDASSVRKTLDYGQWNSLKSTARNSGNQDESDHTEESDDASESSEDTIESLISMSATEREKTELCRFIASLWERSSCTVITLSDMANIAEQIQLRLPPKVNMSEYAQVVCDSGAMVRIGAETYELITYYNDVEENKENETINLSSTAERVKVILEPDSDDSKTFWAGKYQGFTAPSPVGGMVDSTPVGVVLSPATPSSPLLPSVDEDSPL